MISINNGTDNDAEVIAFEEQYGGDFEHAPAVSADGGAGAVDANIGITAYPTYFIIAPDNTLVIGDIWPINDVSTFENALPSGVDPEVMECSSVVLGSNDVNSVEFSVYPNPSDGSTINIAVSSEMNKANVIIYNILGSVVYKNNFDSNQFSVSPNLRSGSYIVSVSTEKGTSNKSLIVK